jgi:hypothetical protein
VLEPCLKERISGEQGAEVRDRHRVTLACAVMCILCIREEREVAAANSNGTEAGGQEAGSVKQDSNVVKSEEGGRGVVDKELVLERRALVQLVRVLQAAVDSVAYGGVKFSLQAALHALPAAVASAVHVSTLCELGIVELLVAVVKQFSTEVAKDSVAGNDGGVGSTSAHAKEQENSEMSLRVLGLCVRVMRRMCSPDLDASTQGLCIQRLNIVGAQGVMTTLVQQLVQQLDTTPRPSSSAAPTSPPSASQPSSSPALLPANISKSNVLEDANVVLHMLSQAKHNPLTP